MIYVLAIYENEARLAELSLNELRAEIGECRPFDTVFRWAIKGSRALQLRNGEPLTVDGPFKNMKEQLGGFYVIEADHVDDAIAIAARIPAARHGSVEIRQVQTDLRETRTTHDGLALNASSRSILAVCSLILSFGAFAHLKAFGGLSRALANASLPVIYANDFKTLWVADSTTLTTVALLFAWIAFRPSAPAKSALPLIALIPASTALLLYRFVGSFYAGHLLLGTAVAAVCAFFSRGDERRRRRAA